MNKLAPLGPVYQAGTLSGNPVAVAAGMATLRLLQAENPYPRIADLGRALADGLTREAHAAGVPLQCPCLGGVFTPFFTGRPVRNLADAKTCDTRAYAAFFQGMLKAGLYLPPAQFEVGFVSAAHGKAEIEAFVVGAQAALKRVREVEG